MPHSLERVATHERGPVYRGRPDCLGLPESEYHAEGTADLEYDPKALVWIKPAGEVSVDTRVPGPMLKPRSLPGKPWEVFAGRVRMWTITAPDAGLAQALADEVGPGYRVRAVVSEPPRTARVGMRLTNDQIRALIFKGK